jgi:hypothetical protein
MNDNTVKDKKWHIINNSCVELRYEDNEDMKMEADYISEVTAVFTTANARMRLYDMLDWLDPSQILYTDTDSVFFVYDKTNPLHRNPENPENLPKSIKFGDGLGNWSDEHKGHCITEMVLGGAKSYAYVLDDGTVEIKQKGITMDRRNANILTFDKYKKMVLNHEVIETAERHQFRWHDKTKDIITKFIKRSVQATIGEKRTISGYDTVPYGFCEKEV